MKFLFSQGAFIFILITMFLNFVGFSILIPVLPFLIQKYLPLQQSHLTGFYLGSLMSTYALCQFFAAPVLGALSDRFGRRPILLISLLGSIVGYIFLGIGGSLGILFIGRIIDGLTGGNISTVYAYIADITKPQDRGKLYGFIGAAGGFGFMIGPVIGGFTGAIALQLPFFIAAGVSLLNLLWGYFVLPESLKPEHRASHFDLQHLNPFRQIQLIASMSRLRLLFIGAFFFFLPLMAFQTTNAVFMKDILHFGPQGIGTALFTVGIIDIFAQGYLTHKLLPILGELKLTIIGLSLAIAGYFLFALVGVINSVYLLYISVIVLIIGDGLFEPAMSGLIANSAEPHMQGKIQGANQSIQSAARMIGPFYGGWTYQIGSSVTYLCNVVIAAASIVVLLKAPKISKKE
jgi:DHA1 family tetracycline resistance protein-like MFS transporter